MTHELKTWPTYFQAIKRGDKTCEVRKNDRCFAVGDTLLLREWCPEKQRYTGEYANAVVTDILFGGMFGIEVGVVVMSIKAQPSARPFVQVPSDRVDRTPAQPAKRMMVCPKAATCLLPIKSHCSKAAAHENFGKYCAETNTPEVGCPACVPVEGGDGR